MIATTRCHDRRDWERKKKGASQTPFISVFKPKNKSKYQDPQKDGKKREHLGTRRTRSRRTVNFKGGKKLGW